MDQEPPLPEAEARNLRFLRRLVTVLTGVMIVGLVTVVVLLVIRLRPPDAMLALPETIALPDGTTPLAFTQGTGWYAVVTEDDRILIFDRQSGALRQSVAITAVE